MWRGLGFKRKFWCRLSAFNQHTSQNRALTSTPTLYRAGVLMFYFYCHL